MLVMSDKSMNVLESISLIKDTRTVSTSKMSRKPDLCYSLESIYEKMAQKINE